MTETRIHGKNVPVYPGRTIGEEELQYAVESDIYAKWVSGLTPAIDVTELTIQAIYYRASKDNWSAQTVLFIVMVAKVTGTFDQTIVLRGPTVVILPILKCGKKEYTLLTRQRRTPVGDRFFVETVAGMTDGDNVNAKALKELEEETGIKVSGSDLFMLHDSPLQPSPGIMDEPMFFYYCSINVTPRQLREFEGKMTGAQDENEEIILKVIELDQIRTIADRDMKAWMAYFLYREKFPKKKGWFPW